MKRLTQIGIWFGRILGACVIVAVVGMVGFGIVAKKVGYNQPPPIAKAHFEIQTSSLTYYTPDFTSVDGVPAIRTAWVKEGGRYKELHFEPPLVFTQKAYGHVDVIQR